MTSGVATPIKPEEFFEFVARPELRADPYPFYKRLRATQPLLRVPVGVPIWLASTYDYVSQILRDPRFSSDERNASSYAVDSEFGITEFGRIYQSMVLFRDEPDHKRLRDLVQQAFTRRVVDGLRPRIESIVHELITDLSKRRDFDLISEFAYPLPVIVICELIGVPVDDRHLFHDWARDFAARFEVQPIRTPEMEERGVAATEHLIGYFEPLIASRRRDPKDDLLSSLVAVEDEGDRLSHDELLATCLLLLLAGHETTANLMGNGILALLQNRDQWQRVGGDPSLVRPAVEEMLRYDPPVQLVLRIALEDIMLGGQAVAKGDQVAVILASANRDPDHFPDPDNLDVGRDGAPLIAFGAGIHFCLGAPLARLEAQIALRALVERMPHLELAVDEPKWRPSFVIRGLEELPVRTE